ncbi:MAG: mannose-1-phosphate guanylyltransferase/mannose-6-phosphate isomerase [Hyphomicrobium sp.]|uniref:mannose-1-phosphate guanylyltransferase/mannose-6-phosphate isomerase n=1 Tax=Hyphomicrobium sp. TaxID=82 RepID=UPI00132671D0|nr:mannose-1-phosphate guanylyltransferase/mannose-6-phosphate isomerase [Hyphomicrobium sp.]KAB2938989.1 MAG: mannose-1-phosphate guanylyltransferase/mannose-6-phosphate isomerase [Hyphomicrobium sp.]MBZ0211785.1 mannose-1-phosphate guanylyltransferase/mannose-6-phosphate isomerase [Hyphomicrobium sp.]
MTSPIIPVILSGGSGTRLWPLSRSMYPKQFINFFNGRGSLLAATLRRIDGVGFAAPIVICNNDHRFLVREELSRAAIEPEAIILEPVARNTAAAVAVAALATVDKAPDAVIAVMPSDHVVKDAQAFVASLRRAAEVAATGKLVLFGIVPTSPHTGYGYIRRGTALDGPAGGYRVEAFFEKPDRETAQRYIADESYFWNSGIFVLHARTFLSELERLAPEILAAARAALTAASEDLGFLRLDRAAFARSPNISIDYAVMEKTTEAAMLTIDVGWSDVGSWSALWESAPRDAQHNAVEGDAILIDTENCLVHSERSLVATIGLSGLVIVDTPDALLVADQQRAQDVSGLVARLKELNRKEYAQHIKSYRPWGFFETLSTGPRFQVKLLHVKPGGQLSMQMHHHRSEHWVVVRGTAKVTIGEVEKLVQENESVYITATHWHRLENPGKVPLEMIEVQIGSYLGEDDIIRSDDAYHRAPDETR